MFKAYAPAWAHYEALRRAARRWYCRGQLSQPQLQAISEAYPLDFYRPNIYLRVLLFLLVALGYLAAAGMLGLFVYSVGEGMSSSNGREEAILGLTCLLAALGGQFLLLQIIRGSRTYRAGSDQALLYISLGFAAAALYCFVGLLTPNHFDLLTLNGTLLVLVPLVALLLFATATYGDALVAVATYGAALALLINLLLRTTFGILLVPFAVMGLAVALYQVVRYGAARADYWYYRTCFVMLKVLALVTFYLGGNYLIVREGNAALSPDGVSRQISLAPLFYLFTTLVPLLYIYRGLRRPSRIWLLTGPRWQ